MGELEILLMCPAEKAEGIAYLPEQPQQENRLARYARHIETCAVSVAVMQSKPVCDVACTCGLDKVCQDSAPPPREIPCLAVPADILDRIKAGRSERYGQLSAEEKKIAWSLSLLMEALRTGKPGHLKNYADWKVQAEFESDGIRKKDQPPKFWEDMRELYINAMSMPGQKGKRIFKFAFMADEMRRHIGTGPMMVAWKPASASGARFGLLCHSLYQAIAASVSIGITKQTPINRCVICTKVIAGDGVTCGPRCRKKKSRDNLGKAARNAR